MHANADPDELAKFDTPTDDWWARDGEFKPLHDINPLRLQFVSDRAELAGKRVLDIGCGGGIFTEALARAGANVTGIDLASQALVVARQHAREGGLDIDYRDIAAEQFALEAAAQFDVVTCLEMLEHVPDPAAIVAAIGALVKPGGDVFLSTFNRNPKSYWFGIVAAERVLKLLPPGTHDHAKFITPAELGRYCRGADLTLAELTGMTYNPLTRRYRLERNIDVNYLAHARRLT
ncbi:MAG: bifunctional 2-polyprenyl-6-hydroxyphenol methylase/3-demethylubiquinol 3-O-methyltransferase UbiG [Pseudomonadota bacterium]